MVYYCSQSTAGRSAAVDNQGEHISLPQARSLLLPKVPQFVEALVRSMDDWVSSPPRYAIHMDSAARATIIHHFWYGHCTHLLSTDPGVQFRKMRGQRYLVVNDRVWIRFKLVDDSYLSKNLPTTQSILWNAQLPLESPEIPRLDRLEFGYILDITGTKILRAYILLRLRKIVVWLWQVWGARDDVFPFAQIDRGSDMLGRLRFAYDDYSI